MYFTQKLDSELQPVHDLFVGNRNVLAVITEEFERATLYGASWETLCKPRPDGREYRVMTIGADLFETTPGQYPRNFNVSISVAGSPLLSCGDIQARYDCYDPFSTNYVFSRRSLISNIDLIYLKDAHIVPAGLFDYLSNEFKSTSNSNTFGETKIIIVASTEIHNTSSGIACASNYKPTDFAYVRVTRDPGIEGVAVDE